MSNQIQIGDTLDMQRGRMVYIGDGKADAQQFDAAKGWVTIKAGVVMTEGQINAWHQLKAKQAGGQNEFACSGNGIR